MGAKAALCAGDRFYQAAVGVSVAWKSGKGGGGGSSEVPRGPPPFELPPLWLPLRQRHLFGGEQLQWR